MIRRILTTLTLAAVIGASAVACNSTPASSGSPDASLATPMASDQVPMSPDSSENPMESDVPSAS
jgi:hypothetical protein